MMIRTHKYKLDIGFYLKKYSNFSSIDMVFGDFFFLIQEQVKHKNTLLTDLIRLIEPSDR